MGLFFCFSMGFGAFLGQGGKNLEKNKKNDPRRGSVFFWFCHGFLGQGCKNLEKTKKSTHGEVLRRNLAGDIALFFCFCFATGSGTFLGQGGKNLEKTFKKIGPWRRSEEKLDRRKRCFFVFPLVLDQSVFFSGLALFV